MTKQEFISTFKEIEKIYVIYSKFTNLPYIVHDTKLSEESVMVCLEESDALHEVKKLEEEHRASEVKTVTNDELIETVFCYYAYGITAMQVKSNMKSFNVKLTKLVKAPDMTQQPEAQRPLVNEGLQLAMILYLQEARRGVEKTNYYRSMEEDMIIQILKANYILPVEEETEKPLGLKTVNGHLMVPIFTDVIEVKNFNSKTAIKTKIVDFDFLAQLQLPETIKGFILNPDSASMPLPQAYLQKLKAIFGDRA